MEKYGKEFLRMVAGGAAALILLTACSGGAPGSNANPSASEQQEIVDDERASSELNEESNNGNGTSNVNDDSGDVAESGEANEGMEEFVEPVSIPEHDIYLYPEDDGVNLQIGEYQQSFDWTYTTPRLVMPVLELHDYDRDGEEELAVVLHVGSGTGVSVDELHIVEFTATDSTHSTDEQPFVDYVFEPDDYYEQLRNELEFEKVNTEGELFGDVTVAGQTTQVNLQDYQTEYGEDKIYDDLSFGHIANFRIENGELWISAAVGLRIEGVAEPQYIGRIEALVHYDAGTFKLDDHRFMEYE